VRINYERLNNDYTFVYDYVCDRHGSTFTCNKLHRDGKSIERRCRQKSSRENPEKIPLPAFTVSLAPTQGSVMNGREAPASPRQPGRLDAWCSDSH
jgi:hypothetical protein